MLFPALAIPTVIERANLGRYDGLHPLQEHKSIAETIRQMWLEYPSDHHADVGIVVGSREKEAPNRFTVSTLEYKSVRDDWQFTVHPMPTRSATLEIAGSGSTEVRKSLSLWNQSNQAFTSRAVFSAFCEAIASGADKNSGGPPQLVGLHRKGTGKTFGILSENRRYLSGTRVSTADQKSLEAEWFNELFERVDPQKRARRSDAQIHQPR